MIFKCTFVLIINIIFGLCIGHSNGINVIRPVHRIPIRPLDRSTMRRLSLRPAEINPDSESIFASQYHYSHRPLQIMERISADSNSNRIRNQNNNHNNNQEQFNVLNFDAYVMKPSNTINMNPVNEHIYRLMNQSEYYQGDPKISPTPQKYRSKNKSKKHGHGLNTQFDDLEFYQAYLEHQKQATMLKRLKLRPEPSAHLPVGIEFMEQKKKNKFAYQPITYAPVYMNNLHRSHHYEDVGASSLQHVKVRHPNIVYNIEGFNDSPTTPFTIIQTTLSPPLENEVQPATDTGIVEHPNEHSHNESTSETELYHSLASKPEMYRFTIDDVVFKQPPVGVAKYTGPVTLPPPLLKYQSLPNSHMIRTDHVMPMSANNIYDNQFDAHYPPKRNYEQNLYINTRMKPRQPENFPYKNMPMEEASSHQEIKQYSIGLTSLTTQMPIVSEKESNDTALVKFAHDIDPKRPEKRNRKRRPNSERHRSNLRHFDRHQNDMLNNLEFSSSYTKRRTQGYQSEEEPATTPITPEKLKTMHDETQPNDALTTTTLKNEKHERGEKNEKVKHFS